MKFTKTEPPCPTCKGQLVHGKYWKFSFGRYEIETRWIGRRGPRGPLCPVAFKSA